MKERHRSAHGWLVDVMDIDEEIRARVRAAKAWDPNAKLGDFQIRATEGGYILINLKTGSPQFIFDTSYIEELLQPSPIHQRRRATAARQSVARDQKRAKSCARQRKSR
jgi:hypothetical protein